MATCLVIVRKAVVCQKDKMLPGPDMSLHVISIRTPTPAHAKMKMNHFTLGLASNGEHSHEPNPKSKRQHQTLGFRPRRVKHVFVMTHPSCWGGNTPAAVTVTLLENYNHKISGTERNSPY
jgi:hypothetical protein